MLAGSAIILLFLALGIGSYLGRPRGDRLPAPDTATYQETARRFYRGLAALDVGLLDDAATEFLRAAELVPAEPASWANLGLTHVRRGAIDEAAGPLDRAQALAPSSGEVALLRGLVAGTDGRLDEGIAHLRRAVDLRPDGMQARFALAEAIERAGGPDADGQAAQLLEEILARQENLAVRLERARLAAKLADGPALRDSVLRLGERAAEWPPVAVEQYGALQREAGADDFGRAATAIAVLRNVLVRVPAFRASLAAVQIPPELIGEPLDRFLALPVVSVVASPPDESLTFPSRQSERAEQRRRAH